MNFRPFARRALKSFPPTLLAVAGTLAFSSGAAGAGGHEIEGVWSFKGGAVDITQLPNGNFQGTVTTETQFAECPHQVGEVMWTRISEQPDGSFWGFHQWFRSECKLEPQFVGPTAWRVLHESTGARYLKVCFNHPGTSQPKIAPDGAEAEVNYGCYNSSLIAPLPTVSGEGSSGTGAGAKTITFGKTVILPNAKVCVSHRSLKIKLKDPKYDPLEEIVVRVNGKKVATVKGVSRIKQGVTLKKLPSGTYKLTIVATTILKQNLLGSRTYRSCSGSSGKIQLHHRVK
jgi:hypothetical protein